MFHEGTVPLEQPPLGKEREDGVPWVSSDWASLRTGPFDLNSLKMGLCLPQTGESLKIGCVSSDQGSLSQAMPPLQTLTVTAPRGGWLAELPLSEELFFTSSLPFLFSCIFKSSEVTSVTPDVTPQKKTGHRGLKYQRFSRSLVAVGP